MYINNNYNSIERKISFMLTKKPIIKFIIKKLYQKINYKIFKKDYLFKGAYEIKKLSILGKESFFGYYDKSPINLTNRYIIFHSTNISTKKLPDSNIPVDLVLYDMDTNSYEMIDKSFSYNWQQGTKLMWLNELEFIFNNYDKSKDMYIAKIYNINTKEFRIINFPIYDCFEDKLAISLNFDRLNIGRADYAYTNREVEIDWSDNSDDGLYFIDLEVNSSRLIITIDDIIKLNDKGTMKGAKHKFNHIMISPNGRKVMFIHRWFTEGNRRYDTLYVSNIDGSNIKKIADDDMVSHCFWYADDKIFGYMRDNNIGDKYYLIDIKNYEKSIVGKDILEKFGDGHPSILNNIILFDTYPNKARLKELCLFDCLNNELNKLGEFYESLDYYGETRCDLHPRFSFDGERVFFDSVHDGQRQLYYMDISVNNGLDSSS
jgi:hypothetical protein